MAVALDVATGSFTGGAATSYTYASLTIGGISNGVLLAVLQFGGAITSPVIRWDSTGTPQTMALIGSKISSDNVSIAYLFGLRAPHTGSHTFSAAWTGSQTYCGALVSFSGADQTADNTTFKNTANVATTPGASGNYPAAGVAITTTSGDMAIMSFATSTGGFAVGGGLGTAFGTDNTNVSGQGRYLAAVGATTTVAANSTVGSQPYCGFGCAIAAVGNISSVIIPATKFRRYLRR